MKLRAALLLFSLSYTLATPLYPDVVRIQNNSRRAIRVYHGPSNKMPHIGRELIIDGIEIPPNTSFNFEYIPAQYGSPSQPDTVFMIVDRLEGYGSSRGTQSRFNLTACQGGLLITFDGGTCPNGANTRFSTYPEVQFKPELANFSDGTLYLYPVLNTRGE